MSKPWTDFTNAYFAVETEQPNGVLRARHKLLEILDVHLADTHKEDADLMEVDALEKEILEFESWQRSFILSEECYNAGVEEGRKQAYQEIENHFAVKSKVPAGTEKKGGLSIDIKR